MTNAAWRRRRTSKDEPAVRIGCAFVVTILFLYPIARDRIEE